MASLLFYLFGRICDEDGAGLRARAHLPSRPLQQTTHSRMQQRNRHARTKSLGTVQLQGYR